MKRISLVSIFACLAFGAAFAAETAAQASPDAVERIAVLKQQLQSNQAALRRYQWIETTVIAKGGEEKSRKQNTCYYGADGVVQKLPIAGAKESKAGGPPGILPVGMLIKKMGERKKDELKDYLQRATDLVQSYVPPQGDRIQSAMNAGKLEVRVTRPGKQLEFVFRDYRKPGDSLRIDLDLTANRILGMHVSSYLDERDDAIAFNVLMGVLEDGTMHPAKSTLEAKAKDVTVTVENSGYRRMGA